MDIIAPSSLYNFMVLKKEANCKHSLSADKMLLIVLALDEKKVTSCPRTDRPYISNDILTKLLQSQAYWGKTCPHSIATV